MKGLNFLSQKKNCINVFCYENKLNYSVYLSDENFKDPMNLLFISDENKSHYVYIKDFDRFMFSVTKSKKKKYFCKSCLQCLSTEKVLIDHREDCLVINGKQSVKLGRGWISFKNYFKQLPVPLKIFDDFEYIF